MQIANEEMAAAWDGDEGRNWAANADRYELIAREFKRRLLDAAGIGEDSTVLDIGCGNGGTTRDAARMAPSGSVLGVDLSGSMLERARTTAAADGLTNVRFEQADAQVHPFERRVFDVAISSFGCMFFADPVAAFRNVGGALRDNGRIALLAWRGIAHNDWAAAFRTALAAGRDLPAPPPDAPGPFAFARRDHVEQILSGAGFTDIALDEVVEPLCFGRDVDDAFGFVSTMGLTRGLVQDLDEPTAAAALETLRRTLADHETAEGVLFSGSAWLITARSG